MVTVYAPYGLCGKAPLRDSPLRVMPDGKSALTELVPIRPKPPARGPNPATYRTPGPDCALRDAGLTHRQSREHTETTCRGCRSARVVRDLDGEAELAGLGVLAGHVS